MATSRDLLPDGGHTLGAVSYAVMTAHRLAHRPGALTRLAPDIPLTGEWNQVIVQRLPSATTTTFRNQYLGQTRRQIVSDVAPPSRRMTCPQPGKRFP
ncbi:MAG: hypothetical protein HZY76_04765 [Anaerolineae bacterium]|nr:MAG: hypothetical protein HZY76_04765 [Anaerolineae bacterium]